MNKWSIVAYRKICKADRTAIAEQRLLPRRFELHLNLDQEEAMVLFESYTQSPQVLAVEMYDEHGLVSRYDVLIELMRNGASAYDFMLACQAD